MHVDVVIILLENEAHVDLQEEHGWTSLMVSCQNGHVNVVKLSGLNLPFDIVGSN